MINNFIYADLSTYQPLSSINFYEQIFNWHYFKSNDHFFVLNKQKLLVGLYETPKPFQQINMPHFWMSYISVESVSETVTKARAENGIIELEKEIKNFGKIALIRDTQGAGFTVFEGNVSQFHGRTIEKGALIWNELHVSNIENVIPFYQKIFNWKLKKITPTFYKVYNADHNYIADILEIPNTSKGKHEYWVCSFGVKNLTQAKNNVLRAGGQIITSTNNRILVADNSGQAFFYLQLI